jgi:hypothetical protein
LATQSKDAVERAEANFKKKELQAREASKAMAEYQGALRAEREKTARLKGLREAKQAAEATVADKAAAEKAAAHVPANTTTGAKRTRRKSVPAS